jgi:hypothetical protein
MIGDHNKDINIAVRSHISPGRRAKQDNTDRMGDLDYASYKLIDDVWIRIHTAPLSYAGYLSTIVSRLFAPVYYTTAVITQPSTNIA